MTDETRDVDPDEGYVSGVESGWIPIPRGMKRVVIALNVPDDDYLSDVADAVESLYGDSDPTVWGSRVDFIDDWLDGVA